MSDRLMDAAKSFLLAYFPDDGERKQPNDFDIEILGGVDREFVFGGRETPRWNSTIFFNALAYLVDEGKIKFEILNNEYYYWKPNEK